MSSGIARSGFDIDLRDGSLREGALENLLRFGTYELKRDYKTMQTGNIFVEYEQKGRKSGIAVTEAECWVTEFRDDCYLLIPTRKMKEIAGRAYTQGRRVLGGDYDNYKGVLVPWDSFIK